jgi:heterodisulfide reductase subunit A-like polyferredoxin
VLQNAKKLPRPVDLISGNYFAAVDPDKCTGCKICEKRCQMDAIAVSEKQAIVDLDRCIGCGLCATTCESEAIRLHDKPKSEIPARDAGAMYQKILMKRYGVFGGMKVAAKIVLGKKV